MVVNSSQVLQVDIAHIAGVILSRPAQASRLLQPIKMMAKGPDLIIAPVNCVIVAECELEN